MSTKLNRQQVSVLIKETIENKLFEHKLTEEIGSIYESRQDLQSAMLIGMMEEMSGKKIPDPTMLDEGIWEKAKGMLAKIRLSKSTGASKQRDALEAAANKAANAKFSEMFAALKQAPGFDKFPNNEKDEEFVGITTGLGIMYQSVVEAHKDGLIETDTANDLISNIKGYVDGLEGDLSYSYRYFNEDEDADEDDDVIAERLDNSALNFVTKVLDKVNAQAAGGPEVPKRLLKKLNRKTMRWAKKGYENLDPEQRAAMDTIEKWRKNTDALKQGTEVPGAKELAKNAAKAKIPSGGGGDLGPELGPEMDPSMPDEFGNYSDPGPGPDLGQSMMGDPSTGIGDIGGVQDLGRLYQKAGSLSTLSGWLGPGFLKSVAGFALPVAAIGGIAALVGKRLLGKSREGSLKKLSGVVVGVDPNEQGTEAPPPPTGTDPEGVPGGDPGGDPGGAPVVKTVNSNNLALRDADGTAEDAQGNTVFDEPSALALANAQVDWLKANPGKEGAQARTRAGFLSRLQVAIDATEKTRMRGDVPDDRAPASAPEPAAAAAPAAPGAPNTKGVPSAGPDLDSDREEDEDEKKARLASYQNMAEVKRWQKIAGILKG